MKFTTAKHRKIVKVDLTKEEDVFDDLMEALNMPGATIISSVATDEKIVYVIEHV